MYRIIYPRELGCIAIVIPAPECGLTIAEIADKDVPEGVPYKIIETIEIPTSREFRDAWEVDFSNPNGYGGIKSDND